MRSLLNYNLGTFPGENCFDFPDIAPYTSRVNCVRWFDFDTARSLKRRQLPGVHFFQDDYKFNCLWQFPQRYIKLFSRCKYVVGTDFSLYYDFPVALQIYNKYRNHWLSAYYAENGVQMIPNISPSASFNFSWSFFGYPVGSVIAFSDIGAIRDKLSQTETFKAYDETIKRLSPIQVLYFTRSKKSAPSEADVIEIPYIKGVK